MKLDKAPSCPYCGFEITFKKSGNVSQKNLKWSWGCEVCNYVCRNFYRTKELAVQVASLRTSPREENEESPLTVQE